MNDPAQNRYKLWSLVSGDQAPVDAAELPRRSVIKRPKADAAAPVAQAMTRRDELETALLLYSQGLPIAIALEGLCTLPDGQKSQCQTEKISSQSVDLVYTEPNRSTATPPAGSAVHLDIEEIGTFKGTLTSGNKRGMQVAVDVDDRGMVSSKLAYVIGKRGIGIENPQASEASAMSIQPDHKSCAFIDHTGTLRIGEIVRLSHTEVLIRASICPPSKTYVHFRGPQRLIAEVTSSFEMGFMAKFIPPIPAQKLSAALKLADF